MLRSRRTVSHLMATAPAISWGAVFSGVAIGTAVLLTFSSLWLAIAGAVAGFQSALPWIEAISAVVALFIAGALAGWLSGAGGIAAGLGNGLTVWGLSAIAVALTTSPALVRFSGVELTPVGVQPVVALSDAALWATFWSLVVGAVAAGLGGLLGGAIHGRGAPVTAYEDEAPVADREQVAPEARYERPVASDGDRA